MSKNSIIKPTENKPSHTKYSISFRGIILKYRVLTNEKKNVTFVNILLFKLKTFQKIMPTVLSHIPAGSSTKAVLHYGQEIKFEGRFQQYDYGIEGNLRQYGRDTPPPYDLTSIEVPIYLMYSENDFFASPIVSILY